MFNGANNMQQLKNTNYPNQPAVKTRKFKRSKKLYSLITAIILIVVIVGVLLIPQGSATIPLTVNYHVGEKMVYATTDSITYTVANSILPPGNDGLTPNNATIPGQETTTVLSFDGEFYTMNDSFTSTIQNRPFSFSMLEKMNNSVYSAIIFNLGNSSEEIPSGPFDNAHIAQLLNQPVVKVGDSVTVPYSEILGNSSPSNLQGSLTLTFKGIQDLTVPAGTYKVFRIDLTSNMITTIKIPLPLNGNFLPPTTPTTLTQTLNSNDQIYFEYGTMRQIKSSIQETTISESAKINQTMTTLSSTTLNQDVNP